MAKNHYIIPIFIPHKGCPFDCVFCNQKKITGLENEPTGNSISDQIKQYYDTIPNSQSKQVEIAFFGGSFTGIDAHRQEELLIEAYKWKSNGLVQDIRISTRPDYISTGIMENLIRFGVSIIELGVQSMDKDVLDKSGRGHTSEDVVKASKIIKSYGVKLGLQMMLGLPGDSKEKTLATAEELIKLKPDFVRIYPTLIIKDTYLEQLYLEGKYQPLSIDQSIDIAKELLIKFIKNKIQVIRIGLQPTEELISKGSVIAGPFHPSYRQLVESEIIKDFIKYVFVQNNIENTKEVVCIYANSQLISNIVGQNRSNIIFFRNHLQVKNIKTIQDNSIPYNCVKIIFNNSELYYELFDYIKAI